MRSGTARVMRSIHNARAAAAAAATADRLESHAPSRSPPEPLTTCNNTVTFVSFYVIPTTSVNQPINRLLRIAA